MVVNYCVRRILNDGVRDHFKYYVGGLHMSDHLAWTDMPNDISITMLDSVSASNIKSQLEHITHHDHSLTYDIITLADMHDLAFKLEDMVNL